MLKQSYYYDKNGMLLQGNCIEQIKLLPDESIDMVITSPPYWGLRNYGTDPQIWDEDKNCKHEWIEEITKRPNSSGGQKSKKLNIKGKDNFQEFTDYHNRYTSSDFCNKCGAWMGELGLEPTFGLYIKHLINIFDKIWRVLKKEGTCWVNIGDTYAANRSYQVKGTKQIDGSQPKAKQPQAKDNNVKNKSLYGIPDRFKIAMIDNGWICRNEIVWYKPNVMPSSAKDRFTVDFEKVYFFTKSEKYFFEQQLEPYAQPMNRWGGDKLKADGKSDWDEGTGQSTYRERNMRPNPKGRNKRCVWEINTQPLKEAHFAVFPPELVETPVLAGCPEGGIVLDPFIGSGNTAIKVIELGKKYIGIDLNEKYVEMTKKRIIENKLNNL